MSNHLAVATATAALVSLLETAVSTQVDGAHAAHQRPDGKDAAGPPALGVNVYLYQISPNAAFRSFDAPTRDSQGDLVRKPLIGLDLHYLLSFYGSDADLEPQRCLGSVVQAIQTKPVLTATMIRDLINALPPGHFLLGSDLADQFESVKFSLQPVDLEDMSQLWSVFFQTPYSLSLCYLASVVLVESDVPPRVSMPVLERNIAVVPREPVVIDRVLPEFLVFGSTDVFEVRGSGLHQGGIKAFIGAVEASIDPESSDSVALVAPGAGTVAGIVPLRFELTSPFGAGHAGISSNAYPVQVQPSITAIVFQAIVVNGVPTPFLSATVSPTVGATQRARLLLTESVSPLFPDAKTYTISIGDRSAPASTLDFPAADVPSGSYLARVEVDGAVQPLQNTTPVVLRP